MKRLTLSMYAMLIACAVLMPSCKKNVHVSKCKLLSIADGMNSYSFTFEYDAQNRLAYKRAAFQSRLSPDYKFMYDASGRLSQYIANGGSYAVGESFYEWHYVYYDAPGNIVLDTVWTEGTIGVDGPVYPPGTPPESVRSTINYEYDSEHRMIRKNSTLFSYNAAGNRVTDDYGDTLTYDTKRNFLSTDPVLQFVNRDYSANNPIGAGSYNACDLPLEYPASHPARPVLILDYMAFFNPIFTYDY